jgi:hypothetical protein
MIHIITFDKDYKQDIYRMDSLNPSRIPDRIFEGNFERLFARCKKCLWSATIFKSSTEERYRFRYVSNMFRREYPSNSSCICKTNVIVVIRISLLIEKSGY